MHAAAAAAALAAAAIIVASFNFEKAWQASGLSVAL